MLQHLLFPGHSPILSHSCSCGKTLEFSPQLQDKTWELPGNEATFSFVSAKKVIWWVISKESCLETNHLIFWWVPNAKRERVYGHHLYLHYWGRWRTQSWDSHQLFGLPLLYSPIHKGFDQWTSLALKLQHSLHFKNVNIIVIGALPMETKRFICLLQ